MISFEASGREYLTVRKIVKRAKVPADVSLDLMMDILATHCNGTRLNLDGLLIAAEGDFFHDVCGIAQNVNRKTGKLGNCFLPRYAAREENGEVK